MSLLKSLGNLIKKVAPIYGMVNPTAGTAMKLLGGLGGGNRSSEEEVQAGGGGGSMPSIPEFRSRRLSESPLRKQAAALMAGKPVNEKTETPNVMSKPSRAMALDPGLQATIGATMGQMGGPGAVVAANTGAVNNSMDFIDNAIGAFKNKAASRNAAQQSTPVDMMSILAMIMNMFDSKQNIEDVEDAYKGVYAIKPAANIDYKGLDTGGSMDKLLSQISRVKSLPK